MRAAIHRLARQILREHQSPVRQGWAVSVGLFIGVLPLYGLHFPLCVAAASLLRLNKVTMYLAANISNPFVAPFLVAIGIALGEFLRFGEWRGVDVAASHGFIDQLALLGGQVPDLFLSCLLGDAILGLVLGATLGPLVTAWAHWRVRRSRADGIVEDEHMEIEDPGTTDT
jgi:uncharacterized protein (DUF2062 family)